jgi:hypothetical protein
MCSNHAKASGQMFMVIFPGLTRRRSCESPICGASTLHAAARVTIYCLMMLAALANAVSAQVADPINGAVTFLGDATCPTGGVAGGTCYSLTVQCSGIDGTGVAAVPVTVKVTNPGSTLGAVIFITTGGGSSDYDQSFAYGALVVHSVVQAGFTTVQPFFAPPNGWLQGPAADGPRALSCRVAALANWVATSTSPLIHKSGSPMCATGVSGGAAAIGYSLAHFGMGTGSTRLFDMVEVVSGPSLSRIDHGCICDQPPLQTKTGQGLLSDCYVGVSSDVDNTYSAPLCSNASKTHDTTNESLLYHDSIMSDDPPFLNYTTAVRVVLGAQNDESSDIPQSLEWTDAVTSQVTVIVVPDAAHLVPDSFDGALQIANDLNASCVLQPPRP